MVKSALTFIVFLFAVSPAFAHGTDVHGCNSWPDVPINIDSIFDDPKIDLSQNLDSIQQIASDRGKSIPQYHSLTMGIARYEPVLEFHVPVEVEQLPDGLACAYVQHVDVTIGYRNVSIFIANEIPDNSCGFNETMAHEERHVQANREVLEQFQNEIQERFKAYLRLNGVFRVQNPAYAEQLLHDKLSAIMRDVIERMEVENARRQRQIDTREEYSRLGNVCNGELSRIAQNYRMQRR